MTMETKLGIGGLPLFRIRVLDGKHAWEVEGLPIPNPFGVHLFVHEKYQTRLSTPSRYVLTESLSGMIVPGSESDNPFRSIYLGFDQLRKNAAKVEKCIRNAEKRYGVLADLPIATREQLELDGRE